MRDKLIILLVLLVAPSVALAISYTDSGAVRPVGGSSSGSFTGDLTLENGEQIVNSPDDQVDIKDDDGTIYATFDATGVTAGGTNERVTGATNGDYIDFATDGSVLIKGDDDSSYAEFTSVNTKLNPNTTGDVTLFEDTDVGNTENGQTLRVYRKAPEGDGSLALAQDQFGNATISFDGYTASRTLTITSDGDLVFDTGSAGGTDDIEFRDPVTMEDPFIIDNGTIAADDTTPAVSANSVFTTSANTGVTAITDLDSPDVGQLIYLIGGSDTNSSTIADSGNFNLSAAWTASLDDVLILYVQADNDYIEIGRVDN